eukprot:gene14174-5179_t
MPMPTETSAADLVVLKFESAVGLVRSLPQKGPFQPSYSEASKVYGYYKQAKFGPCKGSRPAFWDVVGRAKWDAWSVLGDMPKEEAMENYVIEIKKHFEKLTEMEGFQETQKKFSDAIIPFCEFTGLEMPAAIAEIKIYEKKMEEKKKLKDKTHFNGKINGQVLDKAGRNGSALVEINGSNVKLVQMDENCSQNGNEEHKDSQDMDSTFDSNQVSFANRTIDSNEMAVQMQISSYVDAESSDDDVYCDSVNPDEVTTSTVSTVNAVEESVLDDFTQVTRDSSLLKTESSCEIDDVSFVGKNVQSTPIVKMRPLAVLGTNGNHIGENLSAGSHTDTSTLSSLSAEQDAIHTNEIRKPMSGRLEAELKHEFESKFPSHNRRSKLSRSGHRDFKGAVVESEKQEQGSHRQRELVIDARGSSQTDLTKSERGSRQSREETGHQQSIAEPAMPAGDHIPRRLRRANADSSSDSSESARSSSTSGETIGEQIVKALGRLEHDMRLVLMRLDSIENRVTSVTEAVS